MRRGSRFMAWLAGALLGPGIVGVVLNAGDVITNPIASSVLLLAAVISIISIYLKEG